MKDPTRIAPLLGALQDVWEAVPDLEFSDVLRLLRGEGFEQLDDAEAVVKLHALAERFPRTLGGGVRVAQIGKWSATIDDRTVAVWGRGITPTAWNYSRLVSGQVGRPLHVVDERGEHRRFGIIERIQPVEATRIEQQELPALVRSEIGEVGYLVECESAKVLIGRRVWCYDIERRQTNQVNYKWVVTDATRVGDELRIALADGTGWLRRPQVTAIYRLQ